MLVVKSVNPAKIDVCSMTNKNFAITAVQGKRAIVNVRSAIKEPFAAIVKNGEIKAINKAHGSYNAALEDALR